MMRHILSGTEAAQLSPVLFGLKPYTPPSPKTKKPFETVESSDAHSVSQQQLQQEVDSVNSLKIYDPPDADEFSAQTTPEGAETLLMPEFGRGSNLFNKSRSTIEGYPITLPFTGKTTSPPLDQSGSSPSMSDDPGRIVNVLG